LNLRDAAIVGLDPITTGSSIPCTRRLGDRIFERGVS
jgi:hypothetical protein